MRWGTQSTCVISCSFFVMTERFAVMVSKLIFFREAYVLYDTVYDTRCLLGSRYIIFDDVDRPVRTVGAR